MAKVTITADGVTETFAFDGTRKVLADMLAVEQAYGAPYGQWEADLAAGSARALMAFCWNVWRRAGRDVGFEGILAGSPEIDLATFKVEPDGKPPPRRRRKSPAGGGA